jgi:hypothetical protein
VVYTIIITAQAPESQKSHRTGFIDQAFFHYAPPNIIEELIILKNINKS